MLFIEKSENLLVSRFMSFFSSDFPLMKSHREMREGITENRRRHKRISGRSCHRRDTRTSIFSDETPVTEMKVFQKSC